MPSDESSCEKASEAAWGERSEKERKGAYMKFRMETVSALNSLEGRRGGNGCTGRFRGAIGPSYACSAGEPVCVGVEVVKWCGEK